MRKRVRVIGGDANRLRIREAITQSSRHLNELVGYAEVRRSNCHENFRYLTSTMRQLHTVYRNCHEQIGMIADFVFWGSTK